MVPQFMRDFIKRVLDGEHPPVPLNVALWLGDEPEVFALLNRIWTTNQERAACENR